MANADLKREGEKVLSNVDSAMHNGEEFLGEVKEGFNRIGHAVKKSTTSAAEQLGDVAEQTYSKVVDSTKQGAEQLEDEIKRYPITAMLAAFGVGTFVGMMCRRA